MSIDALKAAVGAAVVWDRAELASRDPGFDSRNFEALALVRPANVEGVVALLRYCTENGISLVAQGGRTGLAGGAATTGDQIICDLGAMNRIEHIDPLARVAVVQAGASLAAVQEAARAYGLDPGIDLAARGSCTIGGMISTNAGGIMAFRNGTMRHRILGLEVVLPDGRVFDDLTRVLKVSAGYDLKQVFVGAEGTLGIVTRAAIRLEPVPGASAIALIAVDDAASAQRVVGHFLGRASLRAAEIMWQKFSQTMAMMLGIDPTSLPLDAPCLLILELESDTPENAARELEEGLAEIWSEAHIRDGIIANSLQQAQTIWRLREETEQLERRHSHPPSFDVSVPGGALDDYVSRIRTGLSTLDARLDAYVFGHLADGNLHIVINTDGPLAPDRHSAIEEVLYAGLRDMGGSFSAEHGVGIDKRDAYERHADPVKLELARSVKALLDPKNLLNPGKIVNRRPRETD
ncbi:FAD-binding oxidoreductase [Mesorhizobium sp. KR1-2]|uniref:FAD-binding oxidoreductase n=1 Tax=Mesorhizobium sp. KR1-2 TaxID=3156609 RepID=UPI0032B37D77